MPIVNLTVDVADVESILQLYDRIQVWRATTENGTYAEITAAAPTAPTLTGTIAGTWPLVGETLSVVLSGADPLEVTFTGTNPLSLSQVLAQINAVKEGLASESSSSPGYPMLTHPLTGTGAWMQVSGDAAAILGLSTTKVNGKAARLILGNSNSSYRFTDLDGDTTYWYKTKFYSTATNATSTLSEAQQGGPSQSLSSDSLVTMAVDLIDATGAPVVGRRVILVPVTVTIVPYNQSQFGLLPSNERIILTTNEAGHAEVDLVIGATLRAFFEGNGYSREFVVPDEDFDLLTVLSTQPDPFSIVQAPPFPIRES